MQLRIDGVHCREPAGTVKKGDDHDSVVLVSSSPQVSQGGAGSGCCLLRCHHGPIFVRLFFPTPTSGTVDMCDT